MTKMFYCPRDGLKIGRKEPSHIAACNIEELSALHLIIEKKTGTKAYMAGRNGGYIGERFIQHKETVTVNYGDEIELFGLRILWLENMIAIDYDDSIECIFCNELVEVCGAAGDSLENTNIDNCLDSIHVDQMYFTKSPRAVFKVQSESIELEPPPAKHEDDKQPVLMTIGPAFTMALPMILGFLVSRAALKQGGTSAFMYTGVVTAIASAAMGVVWASANLKARKKQNELNERKRQKAYVKYVRESEIRIREHYNKNVSNLRLMYPETAQFVKDDVNRFLLWNRSISDEDYLRIRLGTGNIPCDLNITVPKERFSIVEDELKNLPKRLRKEYSLLRDVPITIDLIENRFIGVISASRQSLEDVFLEIITALAVIVPPDELRIITFFPGKLVSEKCNKAVRFLPHIKRSDNNTNLDGVNNTVVLTDDTRFMTDRITANDDTTYFLFSNSFESLPSLCTMVIQKEQFFNGILSLAKGSSSEPIRRNVHFDRINAYEAERIARRLQGVKTREHLEKYKLKDKVPLLELYGKELTEKDVLSMWRENDIRENIKAPIGIDSKGNILTLDLHEKYSGPHGLIGGMTGSGKSELLQTIIISLAINYSPEDIGFFLIDYKGGGMAKMFDKLPHMLGSISNLSGQMISRAMLSVKSENIRRQKVFNSAGVNNITEYKTLYLNGTVLEPMPHIFIIIDEFAELKRDEPDFMKELISVARVGRSLGVHLILATQKPAGVVDDNILSNSRFRICLRLQDKFDSMEMIKRPDAADIVNPGRAILQVGNDEIFEHFQSAYTMEKSMQNGRKKEVILYDIDGNLINMPSVNYDTEQKTSAQLYRVSEAIIKAERSINIIRGKPLWLEPLDNIIILNKSNHEILKRFDICIGIYDDPSNQRQEELKCNLLELSNIVVLGGLQCGKSTLIATCILSILYNSQNDFYNIYLVDFSSTKLYPFRHSLMCCGYINEDNEEDIEKLFLFIKKKIEERKEILKGGNYAQYISKRTAKDNSYIPPIIVVFDGLGTFREHTKGVFDKDLEQILKVSSSLGIYIIASAINVSMTEISKRIFDLFATCIPLLLKDKYEYKDALKIQNNNFIIPEQIAGRGLKVLSSEKVVEFQTYLPVSAEDDFERNETIEREIDRLNARIEEQISTGMILNYADELPQIPKNLSIDEFEKILKRKSINKNEEYKNADSIPVGFFRKSGEIFSMPYENELVVLITGRAGSGKSNLLKVICRVANNFCNKKAIYIEQEEERCPAYVEFENGMKIYEYDESLPFSILNDIKKKAGADPYAIHLGGALDRQNVVDYSYIPFSEQIRIMKEGEGIVRKTTKDYMYGEIVIPRV